MNINPDYSSYSLEELKEAKNSVDKYKYEERYNLILAELTLRSKNINKSTIASEKVKDQIETKAVEEKKLVKIKSNYYKKVELEVNFKTFLKHSLKLTVFGYTGVFYILFSDLWNRPSITTIILVLLAYSLLNWVLIKVRFEKQQNSYISFNRETITHCYNNELISYNINDLENYKWKLDKKSKIEYLSIKFKTKKLEFGNTGIKYEEQKECFFNWLESNYQNSELLKA